jgi:hypothetical protein
MNGLALEVDAGASVYALEVPTQTPNQNAAKTAAASSRSRTMSFEKSCTRIGPPKSTAAMDRYDT